MRKHRAALEELFAAALIARLTLIDLRYPDPQ